MEGRCSGRRERLQRSQRRGSAKSQSSSRHGPCCGASGKAPGFWGERGTRASWVLSGILLLIVLVNLVASYSLNVWSRVIFDALEKRDSATVLELSILYLPLLAGSVFLTVLQLWTRMTMQRRWREWLNKLLIDRWLKNGRYYQLNLVSSVHRNPECRIADDVRIATEAPIEFAAGATSAVLSAAMFIAVLWTVGGAFTVYIGGTALTIPGFLVVTAAVYAVVASGTMLAAGRRLVAVSETKDQAEAEYRYLLTRVRENGEGIALLHGTTKSAAGRTSPSRQCFSRGEMFASRRCGRQSSRKPAVISRRFCLSFYARLNSWTMR